MCAWGRWWSRLGVVWLSGVLQGRAQVYELQDYAVPPSRQVKFERAVFYVYASDDVSTPRSFLLPHTQSTVTFDKLYLTSEGEAISTGDMGTVEVSLIPFSMFRDSYFGDNQGFCCPEQVASPDEPASSDCTRPGHAVQPLSYDMHSSQVQATDESLATSVTFPIKSTDIYRLAVSSCSTTPQEVDVKLTGSVKVRNPCGYLSGHSIRKLIAYFWLSVIYLILVMIALVYTAFYRRYMIHIQFCILGIVVLGFAECCCWFGCYWQVNQVGTRVPILLIISILLSVVKKVFSFILVLVSALGWGLTKPKLEKRTVWKIEAIIFLYITLDAVRQVADEFSASHALPTSLVIFCLFPISFLSSIIYFWTFSSLFERIEILQAEKQFLKLQMYKRLRAILFVALLGATAVTAAELYVATWEVFDRWKVHWFYTDLAPQMLFLFLLICMMLLWQPTVHSRQLAYFTELQGSEDFDASPGEKTPRFAAQLEDFSSIPVPNAASTPSDLEKAPTPNAVVLGRELNDFATGKVTSNNNFQNVFAILSESSDEAL